MQGGPARKGGGKQGAGDAGFGMGRGGAAPGGPPPRRDERPNQGDGGAWRPGLHPPSRPAAPTTSAGASAPGGAPRTNIFGVPTSGTSWRDRFPAADGGAAPPLRPGFGSSAAGSGGRDGGYGGRDGGNRDGGYGGRDSGYGGRDSGYGNRDSGYGNRDGGYGGRDGGGRNDGGYGGSGGRNDGGYGGRDGGAGGWGKQDGGYGGRNGGGRDSGYGGRDGGYGGRDNGARQDGRDGGKGGGGGGWGTGGGGGGGWGGGGREDPSSDRMDDRRGNRKGGNSEGKGEGKDRGEAKDKGKGGKSRKADSNDRGSNGVADSSGGGKGAKGGGDKGGGGGGDKGAGKGKKAGKSKASAVEEDDDDSPPPSPSPKKAAKKSGGTGAVNNKHLSTSKFSELPVSKETKQALASGFGYELMTMVQAATVHPMLKGRDVVARARTGTGKTLAFLVPIVESISKYPQGVGGGISALVMSPTRELATQISHEAEVLLKSHKKLGVLCVYGGTNIKSDHSAMKNRPVDILVATPGRLQDHLDNTPGFKQRVGQLYFLCMDEADQLLDMGFRDAILKILKAMPPPQKRQGALFSATFPAAVGEIAKLALKNDHDYIDTVRPDEEVTPDQIDQSVCVTDMENIMGVVWAAVNYEMKANPKDYKIMVFFVTTRGTQLASELFTACKIPVLEVHSRKSQAHRNKCTQTFREAQKAIIFTSDVSARGLDYPDVTAVLQVGIPSAREQYIHRLGRTGRAGKSGRCILILHDFEQFFLNKVKDLPIKRLNADRDFKGAPVPPDNLWWPKDKRTPGQAYQAWLGYYNSVKGLGWDKPQLVREGTRYAASIGAVGADGLPPPILKQTVGKMGLKGVPGLNIVSHLPYTD